MLGLVVFFCGLGESCIDDAVELRVGLRLGDLLGEHLEASLDLCSSVPVAVADHPRAEEVGRVLRDDGCQVDVVDLLDFFCSCDVVQDGGQLVLRDLLVGFCVRKDGLDGCVFQGL